MISPWWDRWPGRLEEEYAALESAGIRYERDEEAWKAGLLRLTLWPVVDGETVKLVATYPATFPYFRFEVAAPELDLEHHQNPMSKDLCLVGRPTANWFGRSTLAEYVLERVPKALRAARTDRPSAAVGLEEPQAEPFSDYYVYQRDTIVTIDSSWVIPPSAVSGRLEIGLQHPGAILRGAVLKVLDQDGNTVAEADPNLVKALPFKIDGRWTRLDEPLKLQDPDEILRILARKNPALRNSSASYTGQGHLDVVAALFPEEVAWRETGDGWLFVVRAKNFPTPGPAKQVSYLARPGRAGRKDLTARVPELAFLADRRISLAGAGALGGPSAIGLARAGAGSLRIIEHDIVEAGTTVRWPLGLAAAGSPKADALHRFITSNYPYTEVVPIRHRIGGPEAAAAEPARLNEWLEGTHLIYDATAELGVHHFLSDLALSLGLPYIAVSATPGAWGGMIVRVRPGITQGCWMCVQHALDDKSLPEPLADPAGGVQPPGCASPTFTGAGFELEQVALAGVRLAVDTLADGSAGSFTGLDWDVATVAFRTPAGRPIAPEWKTYPLKRHPNCASCAQRDK